jgi:bifunctional non-homologous end joining protein LigD
MIRQVRPMLATSAATLPVGPAWTYEVKWDGYRAIGIKDGKRVQPSEWSNV